MSAVVELPRRVPAPVLDEGQFHELRRFADALSPEQLLWASGYLAGLQGAGVAAPAAEPVAEAVRIVVLYGSQTGTGAALAERVAERARTLGFEAETLDMLRYRRARLREDRNLLLIVSTHGDGDPPDSAQELHALVTGAKAPKLADTHFAVLALGDASYPRFCQAGKDFDEALAAAGGTRLVERVDCDLDYEEAAGQWTERVLGKLNEQRPDTPRVAAVPGAAARPAWTRHKPFAAPLLERLPLTAEGSSREVWHLELDLAGSEIEFASGDSLSIVPSNPPELVEALVERLSLDGDAAVATPQGERTLAEALASRYEITRLTRPFVERYAAAAESDQLRGLAVDAEGLAKWMDGRDVLDVVAEHPVQGLSAQDFADMLRVLPARRYSIASSPLAYPDEAHLTVAPVRWASRGRDRFGVASTQLIERLTEGDGVPVFLEGHAAFRLPEDPERPIIMIGAGTGVAPYRAFLQEREVLGAPGRNWLFFGDRNFRTDFLYQREWLQWRDDGLLTQLDVAFSRDQQDKVYVQDRLRERAADLYAWLEEGAALYVCGAERMGHDVHQALIGVVGAAGGLPADKAEAYVEDLKHTGRYHRDVY
ncbi:MAG: assimilatory sulfite reductase (NADPH) flavoprotein subunit [Acidihalobacter sp.]|uniref:assimilatory sulfite reductase (NADPH) flavoprotein subunit n=1 Tax=Acidihalobacter sp. TaxID=1872108 RepID=UPI00307EDD70